MRVGVSRMRGTLAAGLMAPLLAAAIHGRADATAGAQTPGGVPAMPFYGAPIAQASAGTVAAPASGTPAGTQTPAGAFAVPPNGAAAARTSAVSSDPTEDIRDIRGPKFIYPVWLLPALLAGAALLALGAYGAWRRLRRGRRPRALLPFEITLQQLEEIRALMQPATAKEFSIAVSDIVRRYIEQRFDVTATHRTTEEFLRDLLESANPSLARHRGLLSAFLHQCDLVKFAGMSLSFQSMESLHDSARAFVLETVKPDEAQRASSQDVGEEARDSLPST